LTTQDQYENLFALAREFPGRFMKGFRLCMLTLLIAAGCSGGDTTSSGGPTEFAGVYLGTTSANGFSSPLRITITADGFLQMDAVAGVVCPGDLPASIGLDGDKFSSTSNEQCIFGGFPCPLNTSVSGSVEGSTITGSGQILVGCPNGPTQPVVFTFIALAQS
jgi:hypothetical protein